MNFITNAFNLSKLILVLPILSACAPQPPTPLVPTKPTSVSVNFNCSPPAARLSSNNSYNGLCPITLSYSIPASANKTGSFLIGPITAVWNSGATITIPKITVNLSNGYYQSFQITRPQHDGLDLDTFAAKQYLMEKQASTQQMIIQQQMESDSQAAADRKNKCYSVYMASSLMCSAGRGVGALDCQNKVMEEANRACH
jgi:hypothetical protein